MSQNLHIVRPGASTTYGTSTAPITAVVQSPALFQLLEFALRSQDRVIGTLVGTRSDDGSEYEIRDAYIVPHHEEGDDEVVIDESKSLYNLHKRSHPKDVILGWFSTTDEISAFTSMVHQFYTRSAANDRSNLYPVIHLTLSSSLDSDAELSQIPTIRTYIASPIGASAATAASLKLDKDNTFLFTPITNRVSFDIEEKAVLNYASRAVQNEETSSVELHTSSVDLKVLVEDLSKVESLIDTTVAYIERVEKGEVKGDDEFAKFLLTNLKSNIKSTNLEDLEKSINSHIQDTLMVEYLASSIKIQLELSAKLTTLQN